MIKLMRSTINVTKQRTSPVYVSVSYHIRKLKNGRDSFFPYGTWSVNYDWYWQLAVCLCEESSDLTLFRMGLFRAVLGWGWGGGWGGAKRSPSLKSGTVIPYLKNIQKIYKSRDTTVLYILRLLGQFLLSLFLWKIF